MNFFSTMGLDPSRLQPQAPAAAAAQPQLAPPQPQNIVAARAGMPEMAAPMSPAMPAAPMAAPVSAPVSTIARPVMGGFQNGTAMPQRMPMPAAGGIPPQPMRPPMQGQGMMMHPEVQNFMRRRLGLA